MLGQHIFSDWSRWQERPINYHNSIEFPIFVNDIVKYTVRPQLRTLSCWMLLVLFKIIFWNVGELRMLFYTINDWSKVLQNYNCFSRNIGSWTPCQWMIAIVKTSWCHTTLTKTICLEGESSNWRVVPEPQRADIFEGKKWFSLVFVLFCG